MPAVSVIMLAWNSGALLRPAVESILDQTMADLELVIVDNGSTDGAPELARARGARVIPMGRNAGFAAAVNRVPGGRR